ncbi:MAG: heme-binding beta-barrel domain-containing protein [Nitrospirota bacterium]|nr:heme-binding beta-barrel domain-containing protein [Nitrospirota bacterium]MDH5585148.1 heme-binding beta-barrel domain-containing protein [Nitrospirota bacterium]MDH5773374.1 heme-binding beta-barrel domain-containing protein [Nitrospirota bacterium]
MSENHELPTTDPSILAHLGPLAGLVGNWEGKEGIDIAPTHNGSKETHFRERLTFAPIGPVNNGPQTLYGLRYSTVAWPLIQEHPFHEEVGYWLWDAERKQVMRCFIVPRGVVVNAGGTAEPSAKEFGMIAEAGSGVYGILSNPFLEETMKTIRYELSVKIHETWKFSYKEDTQLQIAGRSDIFHHTDQNTLTRL